MDKQQFYVGILFLALVIFGESKYIVEKEYSLFYCLLILAGFICFMFASL